MGRAGGTSPGFTRFPDVFLQMGLESGAESSTSEPFRRGRVVPKAVGNDVKDVHQGFPLLSNTRRSGRKSVPPKHLDL